MDYREIVRIGGTGAELWVDTEMLQILSSRRDIAFAPNLNWADVQQLYIIGKQKGLEQGCYADLASRTQVMLVGLADSKIQWYLDEKCSQHLEYLTIANTGICHLMFRNRPLLKSLALIGNKNLNNISGLENLPGMRSLTIRAEKYLLPLDLSGCGNLEELDLCGTKLRGLPDLPPEKKLKKCILEGTGLQDSAVLPQPLPEADIPDAPAVPAGAVTSVGDLAPAPGPEDEAHLLWAIQRACEHIQREPECWGSKENVRNRRMRDALDMLQYNIHDQKEMGASASGEDVGELDLMIYRRNGKPWSLIEALRVYDGTKRDWNKHLGKLLDNYNPHGIPFLFLVTYCDCEKEKFTDIWNGYQKHIQKHEAGKFRYEAGSFRNLNGEQDGYLIQTAVSKYCCGGYTPVVYHIFVQMNPGK